MSPELKRTPSLVATNGSKDVSVAPQFVSIINNKGLESSVGAGKTCISPNPPEPPPPCVGKPPPPCVGRPPGPCYGEPPPCYGCYGGCYGVG